MVILELKEFMTYKNWIVVGDVKSERKYAYKILNELKDKKYTAYGVHPKGGEGIYTNINVIEGCALVGLRIY